MDSILDHEAEPEERPQTSPANWSGPIICLALEFQSIKGIFSQRLGLEMVGYLLGVALPLLSGWLLAYLAGRSVNYRRFWGIAFVLGWLATVVFVAVLVLFIMLR